MPENLITRTIEGITLGARWSVDPEHDILTIRGPCGVKSTQLGGSPPQCLATIMLREMYQDCCP